MAPGRVCGQSAGRGSPGAWVPALGSGPTESPEGPHSTLRQGEHLGCTRWAASRPQRPLAGAFLPSAVQEAGPESPPSPSEATEQALQGLRPQGSGPSRGPGGLDGTETQPLSRPLPVPSSTWQPEGGSWTQSTPCHPWGNTDSGSSPLTPAGLPPEPPRLPLVEGQLPPLPERKWK